MERDDATSNAPADETISFSHTKTDRPNHSKEKRKEKKKTDFFFLIREGNQKSERRRWRGVNKGL